MTVCLYLIYNTNIPAKSRFKFNFVITFSSFICSAILYFNQSIFKKIQVTTECSGEWTGSIAEVFDVTGRSVFKPVISSEHSIIALAGIANGVYGLRIMGKGYGAVRKLVKLQTVCSFQLIQKMHVSSSLKTADPKL